MSDIPKCGGPAFPIMAGGAEYDGMTLRDYFAAHALQGMLAYSNVDPHHGNWQENASHKTVAENAYFYADAMLAERGTQ